MTKEEVKARLCETIDRCADEITGFGEELLKIPELGYREEKPSRFVQEKLCKMGIRFEYPFAITGVKGQISMGSGGPNICILGELDAVKSLAHPYADSVTGAAHACGHNAQIAMLLGVALAFAKSGVLPALFGTITFFAVPAEEFIELDFRSHLRAQNRIRYFGGKQELIASGAFDGIDLAMMIHSQAQTPENQLFLNGGSLGFTAKNIRFFGKEAHGSTPYEGINALNAAMLALMGIHANRETFRDEDHVRIHPIVTNGGDLVNTVPSQVAMETYVRGSNVNAIQDACEKVDRCIHGAAMAIGARAEIESIPGYLPLFQDEPLSCLMENNARQLLGPDKIVHGVDMTGSTDMGDLSHIMPCLHACMGGYIGEAHSKHFMAYDKAVAYLQPAKLLALTAADLLYGHGETAKTVISGFHPRLTKQAYLQYLNRA